MILKVSIELEDDTKYHFIGAPREAIDAIKQLMGEKPKAEKLATNAIDNYRQILQQRQMALQAAQQAMPQASTTDYIWYNFTTSGSSYF